ncbi:hypothetical protein CFC21_055932, partial [Triticum aestivum]
MATGAVLSS